MKHLLLTLGLIVALQPLAASSARADDPTTGGVTYEDIDDGCTATGQAGDLQSGAALGLASIAVAMMLRARRGSRVSLAAACPAR